MKVLFLCTMNKFRSPTAEKIFTGLAGIEVKSAGFDPKAKTVLTEELLQWADLVLVMDNSHLNRLCKMFNGRIKGKDVRVLNIPDDFDFMQPELIELLMIRASQFFPVTGTTPEKEQPQ